MKAIYTSLLILIGLLAFSSQSFAQQKEPAPVTDFSKLDVEAEYPGGMKALYKFISENINYPADSKEANIQGKVFVQFTVSHLGTIKDAKVLKGVNKEIDAESLRVINLMPEWTPAEQHGAPVSSVFTLPIAFKLK